MTKVRPTSFLSCWRSSRPFLDRKGATAIEFALVGPMLFMVLMAMFDLGHSMYLRSVLYGAIQKAGRDSTLESGGGQLAAIDTKMRDALLPILTGGTVNVVRNSTQSFSAVGAGEPFTDDNANKTRDPGECFDDENENGVWDSVAGKSGLGGTDDVVSYTVTVSYNRIFPMAGFLGWSKTPVLKAQTVLRNQPFGDDKPPPSICV